MKVILRYSDRESICITSTNNGILKRNTCTHCPDATTIRQFKIAAQIISFRQRKVYTEVRTKHLNHRFL